MKNPLKPILAVGMILIIFLTAIVQSNAAPGVTQPGDITATPRITATLPPPTGTPYRVLTMPAGNRPPACMFPLASLDFQESVDAPPALEDFVFSEPQVVLSSPTGISLAAWLPDNETLLIKRRQPDSVKETIETFNTRTGRSQIYAVQDGPSIPVWLPDLNAVAYTTSVRKSGNSSGVDHYELWISYGSPDKQRLISADASFHSAALLGQKLMYFSPSMGARPQIWDSAVERSQTTPIDFGPFVYSKFSQAPVSVSTFAKSFQIAPHPQGRWSAFYGSALLFLADSETGQVCEIDLGTDNNLPLWAYDLHWSADGRYLAMITASVYPGELTKRNYISVLDVSTGAIHRVDMGVYLYAVDWYPGTLILTAMLKGGRQGYAEMALYLIDIWQDVAQSALPGRIFGGGSGGQMVWAFDGQRIALKCPLWPDGSPIIEDRICVSVVSQQP